jgi:hypothetical protein
MTQNLNASLGKDSGMNIAMNVIGTEHRNQETGVGMAIQGHSTGTKVKKMTSFGIGTQHDLPSIAQQNMEGTFTGSGGPGTVRESFNLDSNSIANNLTMQNMREIDQFKGRI